MFEKIANIFKIPDLRTRVLFTLGLLAVYRLGAHIPTPGINAKHACEFLQPEFRLGARAGRPFLRR